MVYSLNLEIWFIEFNPLTNLNLQFKRDKNKIKYIWVIIGGYYMRKKGINIIIRNENNNSNDRNRINKKEIWIYRNISNINKFN